MENTHLVDEFTNKINGLLPIDSSGKVFDLIKIIAGQVESKTFKFNLIELEKDLQKYIDEKHKNSLKKLFNDLKKNKGREYTTPPIFRKRKIKNEQKRRELNEKRKETKRIKEEQKKKRQAEMRQSLIDNGFKSPGPIEIPKKKYLGEGIHITTWGNDELTPPPMEE